MNKRLILLLLIGCFILMFAACAQKTSKMQSDNTDTTTAPPITATPAVTEEPVKPTTMPTSTPNEIVKEQITYQRYANPRYGFSIDYPHDFEKGREPDNGDGLKFTSPDDKAELVAYGSNNVFEKSVQQLYEDDLKEAGKDVSYHTIQKNWYVISYVHGDIIMYQKTFVGSGSINSFQLKYPVTQKDAYNEIVNHIGKSFKSGDIGTGH